MKIQELKDIIIDVGELTIKMDGDTILFKVKSHSIDQSTLDELNSLIEDGNMNVYALKDEKGLNIQFKKVDEDEK